MSGLLLNPVAFKVMIEEADPRLIGFFDIAIIPNTHSTGSNNESTDAMHKNWSSSSLAFFIRVIHTVFNKDDFHSIKEKRRSNATWLSTGHHMTTCICKQITSCPQIPITYNGASIYNPTNIDHANLNGCSKKMELTSFDRIELFTVHSYDSAI
ncbi:21398_t:CDS:2 [Rhizophagus irregularis]|nr:21398_t:CDS:2 [Rhizophagus irregularis]